MDSSRIWEDAASVPLRGRKMIRIQPGRNLPGAQQAIRYALMAFVIAAATLALPTALRAEQFTVFDVPNSVGTFPQAINAKSEVTGFWLDQYGIARGFVRAADGTITSFKANDPVSINTKGWTGGASGNGALLRNPNGKTHKI